MPLCSRVVSHRQPGYFRPETPPACCPGIFSTGQTRDLAWLGGWPVNVFRPGETHHHRVGRTLRENDNDSQWKLLLPIMPTLHCTRQTMRQYCLTVMSGTQQLSYNQKPKIWQTQAFFIIINLLYSYETEWKLPSKSMFDAWLVLTTRHNYQHLESFPCVFIS